MGNTASVDKTSSSYMKRASTGTSASTQCSEYTEKELINKLQNQLSIDEKSSSDPSALKDLPNPLISENIESWEQNILAVPKNQFALNAFTKNEIKNLLVKRDYNIADSKNIFNLKVDLEGSPITNQKSSGRCWLFASTNVFRVPVQKKFNLDKFQLSQQYLFFYDKLEKSNQFLTNIIETSDLDIDDRTVSTLFSDPISDGGQWTMVVNLVNKYGLVPHNVYPDAYSATSSGTMNLILVNKLKQDALFLRSLVQKSASKEQIIEYKESFMKEVYKILTLSLGVPPKPNKEFTWEFVDKFGNAHEIVTNPLDFYKKFVGYDLTKFVSLIHDPRNEYFKIYKVDKLNNIVEGDPVLYINVPIDYLKQVTIANLKNNEPVFFGSDVGKFMSPEGILDTNNYDYELGFDIELNMDKKDRLLTKSSQMTHAMVITGAHIKDGKPVKWRVMNSWGPDSGKDGYLFMTDEWFDEYVLQAVTSLDHCDARVKKIAAKGEVSKVFPLWDPMGSLA